jgi:thioredoxin reductase (NADPH)
VFGHIIYIVVVGVSLSIPLAYWSRVHRRGKQASGTLKKMVSAGLTEPVSLHPVLDPNRCISIGACADACPEGDIIGLVNGRPELVNPTRCIGHGACAAACPVGAITLVFGTETRGVELPYVKETFETNVPGIYIAGELGGMGLIRNAVTQGREAIEYIARTLNGRDASTYDVAIIGAGPAGLAATLEAKKRGLRAITLEQDDIGGTVLSYPRHKIVMTQPMDIPLYGKINAREIQKEELLDLWQKVIAKTEIRINTHEKLESVQQERGTFTVRSSKGEYRARRLLLAIGRRGTPRRLGVEGEDSAKVTYKLIEPEQYRGKKVLVVGGGDSAVEAALATASQPGTEVTLSYRKNVIARIKDKNRERLERATRADRVRLLLESQVKMIQETKAIISQKGRELEVPNHYVLVFIGGELPTMFLKGLGIRIEMKFGER